MFTLTAQFETAAQLRDFLGTTTQTLPTNTSAEKVAKATEDNNVVEMPKKKSKAKSKAKKETPAPVEEAHVKVDEPVKKDAKVLNYKDDVRPTAVKLTKLEGGRDMLVKIFDSLGVTGATELEDSQLPTFLAEVEKYIKALTPADEE